MILKLQRLLGATLMLLAGAALAQIDKPVKILVGFPPGGSADVSARLIAERMSAELKQNVYVENKPGAGGRIVAELLKNAPADGGTLMLAPVVVPVLAPMVFAKLNYDPATDFAPVASVANFQFGVVVNASHPAKTLPELIAWYRVNEKLANFGSPAPGSLPHYFGTMFARGGGVELVHVPFSGGAPLINALVGNQVTAGIDVIAPELRERFAKLGLEPTGGSAADLAATMQRDRERWAPVVKASGFRGD